jgi:dTMP kinase
MLLVIDGIDGVGKTTQVALLVEKFKKMGVDAVSLKSPNYGGVFGKVVKEYLSGDFGSLRDVHPKLAALVYLSDMRDTRELLLAQLLTRSVVICDRYYVSTLAYRCGHLSWGDKLVKEAEDLAEWIDYVATEEFLLPEPDVVIQLDGPVDMLAQRVAGRRRAGDLTDIHEDDLRFQENVKGWYARQAAGDPMTAKNWVVVPIIKTNGTSLSVDQVASRVWEMAFHYCRDIVYPASLND